MDAWIGGQKDGDGCNSVVDGLQKQTYYDSNCWINIAIVHMRRGVRAWTGL